MARVRGRRFGAPVRAEDLGRAPMVGPTAAPARQERSTSAASVVPEVGAAAREGFGVGAAAAGERWASQMAPAGVAAVSAAPTGRPTCQTNNIPRAGLADSVEAAAEL